MSTRQLHADDEVDSPRQEPLSTPQFTGGQDFFRYQSRPSLGLDDVMDSPQNPMTFRPSTGKNEFGLRPSESAQIVRVGALKLEPETLGAIEELGLQVDDYPSPSGDLEPRLEIEKLRALSEEAIKQIKDKYLSLESDLLTQLTSEEQGMMQMTRPDCLQELGGSGLKEHMEGLYGSVESLEELKNIEKRWATEVRVLRDEVERLRKRVADSEGASSSRHSLANSLTSQNLVSILKSSLQAADSDSLEKCSGAILQTYEKDVSERESQIRKELEDQFEQEKEQIKDAYEEQMAKAVEETRTQVTEFWQTKMKKSDDLEKLRSEIYSELEAKMTKEYEEKLRKRLNQLAPKTKETSNLSDLKDKYQQELDLLKANQEVEFELRLASEKEAWKRELTAFGLEDHRRELEQDFEEKLAIRTQEIKDQSKSEVAEMAAHFRAEAQEAISQHLQRLSEDTDRKSDSLKGMIREECLRELRSEREMKLQEALAARITSQLDRDLRRDLTPRIEKEVRSSLEDRLRTEIRKEFEEVYETRKTQLEQEMKHKLRSGQDRVEAKFEEDVNRLLQDKVAKIEKELKIKYKTKLERQQKQIETAAQQEYQQRQEEELQELRREKSEVARLKSSLNVQMKKVNAERREELEKIKRQELDLERKTKELSYQLSRLQIQEALGPGSREVGMDSGKPSRQSQTPILKSEQPSVSPMSKPRESRLSPQKYTVDSELMSSLPRPLSPPQLSRQSPPSTDRNNDKEAVEQETGQRFLPRYDSQDLVKQLISKNLEDAQREAVKLLQQTEKPPVVASPYYPRDAEPTLTSKPSSASPLYYRSKEAEMKKDTLKPEVQPQRARHQLYQDLLKDHFKVIAPHEN